MVRLRPDMYVLSSKHIVLCGFLAKPIHLCSHNATTIRSECFSLQRKFSTSTHLYIIFRHCHCFHKTKYFCSLDYTNCSLVIKIKITITYNLISLLKELEYERTEESIHGYEYVFLRAQLMVIIIMCLSVLVSPPARFSHGL